MKRRFILILTLSLLGISGLAQAQSELQTEYVFLITFDGLRWQEVFTGADPTLVSDEDYVSEPDDLRARFWDDDPLERRQALMPFFWTTIAQKGQLFGNRAHGSKVDVTNAHWFSYPGYNEILVGYADDQIASNDKVPNPNETVLEIVHEQPGFTGKVAVFGSWDVFPYIVNEVRSGLPVNAGFDAARGPGLTPRELFLNELQTQIPSPWPNVRLDAFTYHYALEYVKKVHPRLVYLAFGETDDFAHDGHYDAYLKSAHQTDAFIAGLWQWIQSYEPYRNKTTLVITTDHGRGTHPKPAWKSHGTDVEGSNQIWFAVLGPDTRPLGEIRAEGQYYQNQIAKTTAAFLGVDYRNERPVGEAITEVVGR